MGKLVTYIKEEEFSKVLKAEKKREFKLAYLLAYGSGLRISEIIGYKRLTGGEIKALEPSQIDVQAKVIRVIGGKNMKDRIVPLFPGFKEEYLRILPLKIKRSTLQAHFKTLCMRVLNKPYHFHQLRHGFAVASIKQGVKLPFLQMALGHSRLDTTGIYTQSDPQDMLNDYKKAWGEI
jgi:integrase/recombinase XerD